MPHTAERPFWCEERFLSVSVFAEMCFGAVFNIIFHIFFIAVGAFGHLYSQEDTENPSKLSLLHLNHSDCVLGGVGMGWGWGGGLSVDCYCDFSPIKI